MSETCPKCGSSFIEKRVVQNIDHKPPHDITYRHESVCGACYHVFQTVFDCITTSPEVLAEKLVYRVAFKSYKGVHIVYRSTLYTNGESWDSEKRAIAATVARLNKVDNGR